MVSSWAPLVGLALVVGAASSAITAGAKTTIPFRREVRSPVSRRSKEVIDAATKRPSLNPPGSGSAEGARRLTDFTGSALGVHSCQDILYTSTIHLGGQPVEVVLDTGSADLWVLQEAYDHSRSPTYRPGGEPFEIAYADGDSVEGFLSHDEFTWGPYKVPDQVFAEIEDGSGFSASCHERGLLGLAMDKLAHSQSPTPFHNLVSLGLVETPVFTFLMADDAGGVLSLGDVDESHYHGTLQWHSILGADEAKAEKAAAEEATEEAKDDDDDEWKQFLDDADFDDEFGTFDDVRPKGSLARLIFVEVGLSLLSSLLDPSAQK